MKIKSAAPKTFSKVHQDFADVLDDYVFRLSKGREIGRRISIASIAEAAGHSRSLISDRNCAFPDLRARALELIKLQKQQRRPEIHEASRAEISMLTSIVKRQQDRIYEMHCLVEHLQSQLAASELGRENLRKKLEQAHQRICRSGAV